MIDNIIYKRVELGMQISPTTVFARAKRGDEMMRMGWTMEEIVTLKKRTKIIQPKRSQKMSGKHY